MRMGSLLASVCALGLLAAAPAYAATGTTGDNAMGSSGMANGTGMNTAPTPGHSGMSNGGTATNGSGMTNGESGTGNSAMSGSSGMSNSGSAMNGSGMSNGSGTGNAAMSGSTGMSNHGSAMNGSGTANGSGMSHSGTSSAMGGTHMRHTTHHRSAMRGSSSDTSQNDAVARLNEQSLQAARQGHSFQVGSADEQTGGSMSNNGSMQSGQTAMPPSQPRQ